MSGYFGQPHPRTDIFRENINRMSIPGYVSKLYQLHYSNKFQMDVKF